MNEINDLRDQTEKHVQKAYFALRTEEFTKEKFRRLEESLSTLIYETEGKIQQNKVNKLNEIVDELYRRRSILKRIADGLAWIMFDFNSETISPASIGHSPGFMAGKKSYKFERNIVRALYTLPEFRYAIQCDITNILRLGDVMAFRDNGEIIPIEVKGRKSGRSHRQMKRFKQILKYARTGSLINQKDGSRLLRSQKVSITFEDYRDELENIAKEALIEGIAWQILDNSLLLVVLDTAVDTQQQIDEIIGDLEWREDKLTISSLGRHLSKDKEIMPRTGLAITVFPIPNSLGLKFLLRQLDAVIVFNKANVLRHLSDKGLDSVLNEDGSANIKTQHGNKFSIINGWDKILNELVTIPCFVDFICAIADNVDSDLESNDRIDRHSNMNIDV